MNIRRMISIVAVLAVLAVLAVGTATPSPARASATSDHLIVAGIAAGVFVGVVVVCTAIIYGSPGQLMLTPEDIDVRRDVPEPAVRVGKHCKQTSTSVTLFCW